MRNMLTQLPPANGGSDVCVLIEKSDIFRYQDGKKISDERIGVKLTVALPGSRLTPLGIKFDHDPLPEITDEEIAAATASYQFLYVQLPDCSVNLYSTSNGLGMTATAHTAHLVTLEN